MKTIEEIIKQKPVFLNDFSDDIDVIGDFFQINMNARDYASDTPTWNNVKYWHEEKAKMKRLLEGFKGVNILFASYGAENYSGSAWVLFEKDGKLYEVNGSHCSCYGLEDQWEPEEINLLELINRLTNGHLGTDAYCGNEFKDELIKFLGIGNGIASELELSEG